MTSTGKCFFELLHDLDLLQWMVQNENSFRTVYNLFVEKYIGIAKIKIVECPELLRVV